MESLEKNKGKEKSGLSLYLFSLIFFIASLILFLYKRSYTTSLPISAEIFGQFGDFIGGIFGIVGFVLLVLTFQLQQKTYKMQQEELNLTREELVLARKEASDQNRTLALQRFENTFLQLLNLQQKVVTEIKVPDWGFKAIGKGAFDIFITDQYYPKIDASRKENNGNEYYHITSGSSETMLYMEKHTGGYFKQVYETLKFLDLNKELTDINLYVSIFKSQFAEPELQTLFYHILTHGEKTKHFASLAKKYNFFEFLPADSLKTPHKEEHLRLMRNMSS